MQTDNVTLQDLSIFNREEDVSVFHYLNFTTTNRGKNYLQYILSKPLSSVTEIQETQLTIKELLILLPQWKNKITNGTLMVVEKFFETAFNTYPNQPNKLSSFFYKLTNHSDFSLTKYSVIHCIYFIKGMRQIQDLLNTSKSKKNYFWADKLTFILNKPIVQEIVEIENEKNISNTSVLKYAYFFKHNYKNDIQELFVIFEQLDAYLSLAKACKKYQLCFPTIIDTDLPFIEVEDLYHILLPKPTGYNICLNENQNFLFLTGANMAGKSTFIKALGISVYLAQIGMGVPAKTMRLSLFDGLLSNIQVADNIAKGESYFYNEVQRIKNTIEKITNGKKWLILIDELFKGTNVQDAMKCSSIVIEGLHKTYNALFILSTHLYEIADDLKKHNNILFKYFETILNNEQLTFNYKLKDGVSNDRLGYFILKKEGVLDLLEKLK